MLIPTMKLYIYIFKMHVFKHEKKEDFKNTYKALNGF